MHPLSQHLLHHVAGGATAAASTPAGVPVLIFGVSHALPRPTPPYVGGPIHGPTDGLTTAPLAD